MALTNLRDLRGHTQPLRTAGAKPSVGEDRSAARYKEEDREGQELAVPYVLVAGAWTAFLDARSYGCTYNRMGMPGQPILQ